ncbi:MAG: hypothetical protein ACP5IE_06750 [Infirmifilum sp.]
MSEETQTEVTAKAAYNRAYRAEQKIKELEDQIGKLTDAINALISSHQAQPPNLEAKSLRPGQMIHTIISEDQDEITEEIVCPTCGTRELRKTKLPTKIEVKEKPIVPDNYVPAPRSISEAIDMLASLRLPDGRTIYDSDKFWSKVAEYAAKYGYQFKKVK